MNMDTRLGVLWDDNPADIMVEANFIQSIADDIDEALLEGLNQNQGFFTLLLNNAEIKKSILGIFSNEIYTSLRNSTVFDVADAAKPYNQL